MLNKHAAHCTVDSKIEGVEMEIMMMLVLSFSLLLGNNVSGALNIPINAGVVHPHQEIAFRNDQPVSGPNPNPGDISNNAQIPNVPLTLGNQPVQTGVLNNGNPFAPNVDSNTEQHVPNTAQHDPNTAQHDPNTAQHVPNTAQHVPPSSENQSVLAANSYVNPAASPVPVPQSSGNQTVPSEVLAANGLQDPVAPGNSSNAETSHPEPVGESANMGPKPEVVSHIDIKNGQNLNPDQSQLERVHFVSTESIDIDVKSPAARNQASGIVYFLCKFFHLYCTIN